MPRRRTPAFEVTCVPERLLHRAAGRKDHVPRAAGKVPPAPLHCPDSKWAPHEASPPQGTRRQTSQPGWSHGVTDFNYFILISHARLNRQTPRSDAILLFW
jgi:hypothetical protein